MVTTCARSGLAAAGTRQGTRSCETFPGPDPARAAAARPFPASDQREAGTRPPRGRDAGRERREAGTRPPRLAAAGTRTPYTQLQWSCSCERKRSEAGGAAGTHEVHRACCTRDRAPASARGGAGGDCGAGREGGGGRKQGCTAAAESAVYLRRRSWRPERAGVSLPLAAHPLAA
jgi:hypothetical protein